MGLTEEQQDAELQREMDRYYAMLRGMTMAKFVAHKRSSILRNCLGFRRHIAMFDIPVFREHLRSSQRQLVKLRAFRATGIYPGEA